MVFTFPEIDTPLNNAPEICVNPYFFTSSGIKRDKRAVLCQYVHHLIDNDRVKPVRGVVGCRIYERRLKLCNVLTVDLGKFNKLGVVRPSSKILPGVVLTGIDWQGCFYRIDAPLIFRGDHGYTSQNNKKYQCKYFYIRTADEF